MDDDAPLCSLVKVPSKPDDSTTLAALAKKQKPKVATPPKPAKPAGTSPAKPAIAQAKGAPRKRKPSSSSSSTSDGDSDSSSSSSSAKKPRKKKAGGVKKAKSKASLDKGATEDFDGGGAVNTRARSTKQQVAADLLCRWWYAMPAWPPTDPEYYIAELDKKKMRQVTLMQWEWVPEEDKEGRRKVYELKQFRGCFRTSTGELIDTRPQETCPCFRNLMKKDLPELYDLCVTAFENQLKELQNSKYNEKVFEAELKARLAGVRNRAYQAKHLSQMK